jgi:hypothetical protein
MEPPDPTRGEAVNPHPSSLIPHPSRAAQAELPLNGASEDALRAAFAASTLPARGYTFDTALAVPHFKRLLERAAEALLRHKPVNGE